MDVVFIRFVGSLLLQPERAVGMLRSVTDFVSQALGELVPDRLDKCVGQWGARERFL